MFINAIQLKDLKIDCIIGVHGWEREKPQPVWIDVKAFFDFSKVIDSRSIKDTVDYAEVAKVISEIMTAGKYKLLEAAAADIVAALFSRFPILDVEIELKKQKNDEPQAKNVGIVYRATRPQGLAELRPQTQEHKVGLKPHFGKVALVSGSAKGLGRSIAAHLGELGCSVGVHYSKSEKEAEQLLTELRDRKIEADIFFGNLESLQDMQILAKNVLKRFGKVDFLINNVGAYTTEGLWEIDPEEFSRIIQTNICGTYYLTRELVADMRRRQYGRIINIGQAGSGQVHAHTHETPYHISKTGILILTKSIAAAEGGIGITCNMVSPGILENTSYLPKDYMQRIPMRRLGRFEDIFGAIDYLLSDAANYVTGNAIEVAGGCDL